VHKILFDTDVILDFFFDRSPYAEPVSRLLSFCESERISGFITPVICSNVYYILRRTAPHGKVLEKITQLLKIIHILPMDEEVVLQALHSGFRDFEDALQHAAAVTAKNIHVIITRNVKDFRKSDLAVMTPEDYLKQLLYHV
jgi:predicted nucleic acid-binding protein